MEKDKFDLTKHNVVNDYIIVEEIDASKDDVLVQAHGLEKKPIFGKVLVRGESSPYKVGDTVLFGEFASVRLNVRGKDLFYLREAEIVSYFR